MKRSIFITARSQPIPRWREAFPNALLLCGQGGAHPIDANQLEEAAVIWLHIAEEGDTGAGWVSQVRAQSRQPIVVLSNVPEEVQGMAVLAAGASGYCSALSLPVVLRQVASVVEHGGLWVGPQLMRRFMQNLAARNNGAPESVLDALSVRERQVAEAVSHGSTNKEIARTMGITERTVKAHLSAAFEKLGVRDRMHLSLLINGVEDSSHASQNILA